MSYVTVNQKGLELSLVMKGILLMDKKIVLLAVIVVVIGLSGSIVMALPPMGPPRALVGQDRWAVGVGFSHSQMDLDAFGTTLVDTGAGFVVPADYSRHKLEDLTSNMLLGRISYGAYETVDVFVCLGLSDAQDDITEDLATGGDGNKYSGLDCSAGFAYGLGARATFWQEGDVVWGGLVQVLWENPGDGNISLTSSPSAVNPPDASHLEGDVELDLQEIQVAVGPTIRLEGFSVYGGPFLHVVTGDLDVDVSGLDLTSATNRVKLSQDVHQESEFGAFAGAQGEMDQDTSWFVEFQITGDAWGVGIGGIRKF
jgi:hypothetical protein